jgi:hypothetical protein
MTDAMSTNDCKSCILAFLQNIWGVHNGILIQKVIHKVEFLQTNLAFVCKNARILQTNLANESCSRLQDSCIFAKHLGGVA